MAEVRARATLDSTGFRAGVDGMSREVKGFSSQLSGIKSLIAGAFGVGAITRLISSTIQAGSQISDFAYQTGLSIEAYQALDDAARRAGASGEQVRVMFNKLKIAQGDVMNGNIEYGRYFKALGISMAELKSMSPEQLFERMAIALTKADNSAGAFSASFKILGTRAGPALLEVLNEIADIGLQGVIDKAKEAGVVMSDDTATALDRAGDAWARLGVRVKVVTGDILMGAMQIGKTIKKWFTEDLSIAQAFEQAAMELYPEPKKPGGTHGGGDEGDFGLSDKEREKLDRLREEWRELSEKQMESEMSAFDFAKRRAAQLEEIENAMKATNLTTEEVLRLDILRMKAQMDINKYMEEHNKKQSEALQLEMRYDQLRVKAALKLADIASGEGIGKIPMDTDQLSRIGGYSGYGPNQAYRAAERQIRIAEKQLEYIKTLPEDISTLLAPEIVKAGGLE